MDNDSLDPELLKRMMLGDFSASFSNKKESLKAVSFKKKLEVDLHFEKLHPDKPHLSATEKLELQLKACNEFLADARKQSIRNAYIIVGKGEGVLKTEIQRLLKHQKITNAINYEPPYFGNAIKVNL
jgi:DNA-nicking Smr family endonuclease